MKYYLSLMSIVLSLTFVVGCGKMLNNFEGERSNRVSQTLSTPATSLFDLTEAVSLRRLFTTVALTNLLLQSLRTPTT